MGEILFLAFNVILAVAFSVFQFGTYTVCTYDHARVVLLATSFRDENAGIESHSLTPNYFQTHHSPVILPSGQPHCKTKLLVTLIKEFINVGNGCTVSHLVF